MARFFCFRELTKPENVRPFLADPEQHWRKGYPQVLLSECIKIKGVRLD